MEFKVRKESQTLMEKVFNKHARRGGVHGYQIPEMMRQMQPDWSFNQEELKNLIDEFEKQGNGTIDLDGFNKISLHFLLKQARHDTDQFIHKHEIGAKDFPDSGPII